MVGSVRVTDPDSGERRRCAYRDIAVLGRRRANLAAIERGLRQYGIPCYNTATGGLANRQEILDLVTVLKLIDNPHDDYHAFAFLRSPFVGLRDETLARIRLDRKTGGGSLLRQAERSLANADSGELEWFAAPESGHIVGIERRALATGLELMRDAQELADRANTAELLETIVEHTGYRLHLLLRDGAAEAFANIERFFAMLEEYRHLALGSFLGLWERWGEQDLGIPQAPLYSKEDDVVTLSTIHTAKGLEWPIVFLAATREPLTRAPLQTYKYWSDRVLGPVFTLRKAERGPRSENLLQRELLEETAEETRLLYVAATRARDRLVISGPTEPAGGYAQWLAVGLEDAVEEHEAGPLDDASTRVPGAEGERQRRRAGRDSPAADDDVRTGTGRQIDAFGMDQEAVDAAGQFNLFTPGGGHDGPESDDNGQATGDPMVVGHIESSVRPVVVFRRAEPIQSTLAQPPLTLAWLESIESTDPPPLVRPIQAGMLRFASSATELMMRSRDPHDWERRYRHGVIPGWQFAPERDGEDLPATVRGELIHGVLERIQEVEDLARVLNETIAGIDAPELEQLLAPGGPYREALEAEIEEVVRSDRWAWYVEGEHYRELPFVHLLGPKEWRQGALDLYRPGQDADCHIIDFKTHQIDAEEVARKAVEYEVQAQVYREAAGAISGSNDVRVAFHFTHPNVAVEV
jgi:ATP-dependent exoDNAse (exonuclease V) beta subunit